MDQKQKARKINHCSRTLIASAAVYKTSPYCCWENTGQYQMQEL